MRIRDDDITLKCSINRERERERERVKKRERERGKDSLADREKER